MSEGGSDTTLLVFLQMVLAIGWGRQPSIVLTLNTFDFFSEGSSFVSANRAVLLVVLGNWKFYFV